MTIWKYFLKYMYQKNGRGQKVKTEQQQQQNQT